MEKLNFSWRNLTVDTKKSLISRTHKTILKNVSGHVERGELLAVMGPSGAGKTTLFNTLMLQNMEGIEITTGDRFINGVKMNAKAMSYFAGYMLQNDMFIGSLTVREHLTFLSNLKLEDKMSKAERAAKVEELILQMGLKKCGNTVIGIRGRLKGISGGEMRRLCFASEILADPPLLLCDEPTTGLDSWMAENVVTMMRNMAQNGRAIMCVIHQPSSEVFKLFDRVLLLSEGRVAFMGSTKGADAFFNSLSMPCPFDFNPADHYIYKLSMVPGHENEYQNRIEFICNEYQNSEYSSEIDSKIDEEIVQNEACPKSDRINIKSIEPYKAGIFHQFRGCLWRSWKSIIKEPAVIRIRVVQNFVFAVVVGIIYLGQEVTQTGIVNINGVLFWTCMNQIFTNYSTVLNVFSSEIEIMKREHLVGLYRIDVYFMARQLADMPLFLLTPVLFMSIFYFMALPDNTAGQFFMSMLIAIMAVQTAVAMGYLAACCTPNSEVALAIGPAVTTPLLVFGGIYGSNKNIPPYLIWMKYISPWFYSNEAMEINQWQNVENIPCPEGREECLYNGDEVLEFYSMNKNNLYFDLGLMVVLSIGMRLLGYLALIYRARRPSAKPKLEN